MRVVITGATGNLGASVIEALSVEGAVEDITGLARRRPDWSPPKTRFVEQDVTQDDLTTHFRGADAAVLLAWAFQPTHDPLQTWEVNVLGTIRALDAAAEAGVNTVLYVSSIGAYSPGPGRTVDESWPTHARPTAAYSREKSYLERYLDAYELRHSIRVIRLRPTFVFKRSSASEQRRIFAGPLFPRRLARPGRLPVLPVPAGLRFQAVHSDDLAQAVRLALLSDARGAFNVAADPVIDAQQLGMIMRTRTVPVPAAAARAGLGAAWWLHLAPADHELLALFLSLPTLDSTRARTELGWTPQHTGADALREVMEAMADGAGGPTPPLQPDSRPEREAG